MKYVRLPCKLCGSRNFRKMFTKTDNSNSLARPVDVHVAKCVDCGLIAANPRIKDVHSIYNKNYYEKEFPGYKSEKVRIKAGVRAFEWIQKTIGRHSGKAIDLGCGSGVFLNSILAGRGWEVHGLDITNCLQGPAKKKVKFHRIPVEKIGRLKDRFDLAIMVEVAEHLTDPVETFRAINSALNRGGWLFISTANLESVVARLRGRSESYYKAAHVTYWSPATIRKCLEKCGFSVKRISGMHTGEWQHFRDTKDISFLLRAAPLEILGRMHVGDSFLLGGMTVFARKN